jgi:hypothetical protein
MINFLGVLLYILSGEVVLEQRLYKTLSECEAVVTKRVAELSSDPRLDLGLFAACVAKPVKDGPKEAQK